MKSVTIGTRGSRLALAQASRIADRIRSLSREWEVGIQIIKTTGDRMATASLAKLANETKGLFVKEIEDALLDHSIDMAVHSLKDVPTELPAGLEIGIIPEREDPRDALVSPHPVKSIEDIPEGVRIGTSSLRRAVQLKSLRSDLEVVPIRGNVDTRVRKVKEEGLFGVILAVAGLRRMSLDQKIAYIFPVEELVPAIGQGALAIETRQGDPKLIPFVDQLQDYSALKTTRAERLFLKSMGGGCQIPMGAYAEINGNKARFLAVLASPKGTRVIREDRLGNAALLDEMARETAEQFLSQGGIEILEEAN